MDHDLHFKESVILQLHFENSGELPFCVLFSVRVAPRSSKTHLPPVTRREAARSKHAVTRREAARSSTDGTLRYECYKLSAVGVGNSLYRR